MIEVNLLPGGDRKAAKRRRFSFSPSKLRGALPSGDRWSVSALVAALLALGVSAWLLLSVGGQVEELEVQTEAAVRDSIRLADVIEQSGTLQARRDSIAQRVAIIQEIDQSRYIWPHLMDEVARAIPDYAWMTELVQVSGGNQPTVQIEGRAGTYFALTTFMENLEASPFLRGVQLISSEQVELSGGERLVYEFVLEASAEPPPPEAIETVPLFGPSVAAPGPNNGDED